MTRRDLGKVVIGSAALFEANAVPADTSTYTGALDGFMDKVNGAGFDPVLFTHKLYESAPLRMSFQSQNRRDAEQWQKNLRAKITELLGGFPAKRPPLETQVLEVREFPGYHREKFVFQSRPDAWVLAYLLTPKSVRGPHPTVVCIPGHGRGVDDIVGIDDKGQDRTEKVGYQYDFAIQAAEHGMAAVAIEPMAFGCRRDAITKRKGLGASACQPAAGAALLLGQTMIGWRVYDVMRTIDWIETRRELDAAARRLHGNLRRRHLHHVRRRARAAHSRRHGQRLPQHFPRLHHERVALHRQLRARHSQLGRDVRRGRPDRPAPAVRRIGRKATIFSRSPPAAPASSA